MQLYFIRHAQSENNRLWIETGSSLGRDSDPELSSAGFEQANMLATFLSTAKPKIPQEVTGEQDQSGFGITHIYSSLMVRTLTTGSIVAKALNLPLMGCKDLHECGGIYRTDEESEERFGLPGNNREYLLNRFPGLLLPEDVEENGWWNRPFEEPEERLPRARRLLAFLLEKHGGTDDKVALISHFAFYNCFMLALLGLEPVRDLVFVLNNTGITRIDFQEDFKAVVYSNRTDFLPLDYFSR